ncbi:hypothetical protein OAH97_01115, partial [Octadecabacter sp.]|nr:hypothetical protein [Octadecabacter sp.]
MNVLKTLVITVLLITSVQAASATTLIYRGNLYSDVRNFGFLDDCVGSCAPGELDESMFLSAVFELDGPLLASSSDPFIDERIISSSVDVGFGSTEIRFQNFI